MKNNFDRLERFSMGKEEKEEKQAGEIEKGKVEVGMGRNLKNWKGKRVEGLEPKFQ